MTRGTRWVQFGGRLRNSPLQTRSVGTYEFVCHDVLAFVKLTQVLLMSFCKRQRSESHHGQTPMHIIFGCRTLFVRRSCCKGSRVTQKQPAKSVRFHVRDFSNYLRVAEFEFLNALTDNLGLVLAMQCRIAHLSLRK